MEENKETFVLMIGKASCTHCKTFRQVLESEYKYSKEVTIYYIDLDKLTDEEYISFNSRYSYDGTPTITIVREGVFDLNSNIKGGDGMYNNMIQKFKSEGLLKG